MIDTDVMKPLNKTRFLVFATDGALLLMLCLTGFKMLL